MRGGGRRLTRLLSPSAMSSVCCGSKRRGRAPRPMPVACRDMCYFCFDVLYRQLHCLDPPITPDFTDDE